MFFSGNVFFYSICIDDSTISEYMSQSNCNNKLAFSECWNNNSAAFSAESQAVTTALKSGMDCDIVS